MESLGNYNSTAASANAAYDQAMNGQDISDQRDTSIAAAWTTYQTEARRLRQEFQTAQAADNATLRNAMATADQTQINAVTQARELYTNGVEDERHDATVDRANDWVNKISQLVSLNANSSNGLAQSLADAIRNMATQYPVTLVTGANAQGLPTGVVLSDPFWQALARKADLAADYLSSINRAKTNYLIGSAHPTAPGSDAFIWTPGMLQHQADLRISQSAATRDYNKATVEAAGQRDRTLANARTNLAAAKGTWEQGLVSQTDTNTTVEKPSLDPSTTQPPTASTTARQLSTLFSGGLVSAEPQQPQTGGNNNQTPDRNLEEIPINETPAPIDPPETLSVPITFIDWLAGLYTNHANTESLPGKQTAPIEPTPNEFHLPTPAELAGKRDQLRGEITELEARIARLQTMLNENSGIRPDVEAAIRRDSAAVAAASHQLGEVLFALESGFLSAASEHNQPLELQREELRRQMRALDEEFRKAANSDASLWSLYDFHMGVNGRGGQNGDIGNSIPETPVTAEQENALVELYGSLFGSLSPGKQLGAVYRFHQFWLMHQRINALENAMLTRDEYQADDSQLPISDTGPYLVLMDDGSVKTINFSDLDPAIAAYYRRKLITMVSVDVAEARDQDMIDYLANRAGTMLRLVLAMEASLVPGVGEGMDIYTLGDSEASWWAKGFAGGSLLLSVITFGASPNLGAAFRAGEAGSGIPVNVSRRQLFKVVQFSDPEIAGAYKVLLWGYDKYPGRLGEFVFHFGLKRRVPLDDSIRIAEETYRDAEQFIKTMHHELLHRWFARQFGEIASLPSSRLYMLRGPAAYLDELIAYGLENGGRFQFSPGRAWGSLWLREKVEIVIWVSGGTTYILYQVVPTLLNLHNQDSETPK